MKIFSADQIYEADRSTIEKQGIGSDALMERASLQLFNWLHKELKGAAVPIRLFCGIGNNGGDGLALARHLTNEGYRISVYVVNYSEKRSQDFLKNLDRLKELKVWPDFINEDSELPLIEKGDILVDAIFGIGLNRPPSDWVGQLITHINNSEGFRISVDVPSGLFIDSDTRHPFVVKAHVVLSFQSPKLVFFLPGTGIYAKHWELLDIGLDEEFLAQTATKYQLVSREIARNYYRPRGKFDHKGTYGHALIIGGSYGKIGAVMLSAKACLCSGSGLVTAYVPGCGYYPLQTGLPEVMVITDQAEDRITNIALELKPQAIGLGVGMGTEKDTASALSDFLKTYQGPLVVDADGINILSQNKELLKLLPPQAILTPHPGELRRLLGDWEGDFEKLEKAMAFSKKYDCVLLLKGAHSITISKGLGYVNSTGNPGMATAGSGDVLTGIITGLLAQGYPAKEAAVFGTYIHGHAGDIGAAYDGYEALTAGGITEALGQAFLDLLSDEEKPNDSD